MQKQSDDCRYFTDSAQNGSGGSAIATLAAMLILAFFLTATALTHYDQAAEGDGGFLSSVVTAIRTEVKENESVAAFLGLTQSADDADATAASVSDPTPKRIP